MLAMHMALIVSPKSVYLDLAERLLMVVMVVMIQWLKEKHEVWS
jgi:hypothetical protein